MIFFTILLAMPSQTSQETKRYVYSAPEKTLSGKGGEEALIGEISSGSIMGNHALPSTGTSADGRLTDNHSTTNENNKPSLISNATCSALSLCDKIIFFDGFSPTEKDTYTKAIAETVALLDKSLSSPSQENIYSITIIKNNISGESNDRRGRGGKRTITIQTKDIQNIQEFREVLTHEIAHTLDAGLFTEDSFQEGNQTTSYYALSWDNETTKKSTASFKDFVSGYGMTSPYEDFAESFTMYIWHRETFKQRCATSTILQTKFSFIQGLFINDPIIAQIGTTGGKGDSNQSQPSPNTMIDVNNKTTSSPLPNNLKRPRDATRISLE